MRLVHGNSGVVAAGHPLAVGAGLHVLANGGNAVDAALAAQAVLCVVLPNACALGGDALFLVRTPDATVTAVNGTGRCARGARAAAADGGLSVTTPGIVRAWEDMQRRWGSIGFGELLAPAIEVAERGPRVGEPLAESTAAGSERLRRGGAGAWLDLFADPAQRAPQPVLAGALRSIADGGADAFYRGALAEAVAAAVQRNGGALEAADLEAHETLITSPIQVGWAGATVWVQPPPSQAVLLAMALQWLDANVPDDPDLLDHLGIELIEAVFAARARAGQGAALLAEPLAIDPERAHRRGGPRGSVHTTGVATADREGNVVSSLLSVFEDFGSAVFVPECGFILNNRAAGFTDPPNDFSPGKKPVHTLSPILLEGPAGPLAVATPGADGQVQTLLQVLIEMRFRDATVDGAIAAPRWRSEAGSVLVERGHAGAPALASRGHALVPVDDGDDRMGAVVSAGIAQAVPFAAADWRCEAASGAV